jgi:phosphoribosylglycinamide formyltransferase 1
MPAAKPAVGIATPGPLDSVTLDPRRQPMMRLAVLASGRGSNLAAILAAQARGVLPTEVVGVFSDKPASGAIALAAEHRIAAVAAKPRDFASREAFDEHLFSQIERVQPDVIVCAGYMRLISDAAVRRFQGRMINIHPSLLPKFPGLDTHARALAAGDTEHGASVHVVIPALDAGPVIAQVRVPVFADDTAASLAERVLAREHALLVQSVLAIASGRVRLSADAVSLSDLPLATPLQLSPADRLEEVSPCLAS